MGIEVQSGVFLPTARLDSWKEVAAYVSRSVRTVRRWEALEGLPVHRIGNQKGGSVYAYKHELDAWWESHELGTDPCELKGEEHPQTFAESLETAHDPTVRRDGTARPAIITTHPVHKSFWLWLLAAITGILAATYGVQHALRRNATSERIHSLVVLPLENLSGDTAQEYFADGMTAELITELAKIESLHVISRTSAMRYKHTDKPLKQIARELNVDAVLEGQVLNSKRRVRVTAQLIQAATDKHLWAETYERDLRDAVELQGEVAESITNAIRTKVTLEERARLTSNRPVNPEAYEAYLKGRFFWNKRTAPALKKAVEYFQTAIAEDPRYALAYAALADCYGIWDASVNGLFSTKEGLLKAKVAAQKALELDSSLGEAHVVLAGVMYELNRDWHGAEREFKRAIELNPGYATAHQRYSKFLSRMGRHEESLKAIRKAQALDPLSPAINGGVGSRLLWARRYDEAIEQLRRALEMDPNLGLTHMYLGWAYEAKGEPEMAIEEMRKATLTDTRTRELAALGHASALAGHARRANSILKDLEERVRPIGVPPYEIAIIYAGLDKKDLAFEWLAKSCQDQDVALVSLKTDPELDNLRSDDRFKNLLRCVGLGE